MAIQFKMVAKQNNIATPPQIKYYPCAVSQGTIDLERVADIISSRSSLSRANCYGVLIAMTDVIGDALKQGNSVNLESLGAFSLTLRGTAADTSDTLGKANISTAKILFKPAKRLKKILSNLSFKRIY